MRLGIRTQNQFYILDAVASLSGKGYLASIREYVEDKYGKDISLGRQAETLQKFEMAGWVTHEMGEPGSARGERRRKFYRITAPGLSILAESEAKMQAASSKSWAWEAS